MQSPESNTQIELKKKQGFRPFLHDVLGLSIPDEMNPESKRKFEREVVARFNDFTAFQPDHYFSYEYFANLARSHLKPGQRSQMSEIDRGERENTYASFCREVVPVLERGYPHIPSQTVAQRMSQGMVSVEMALRSEAGLPLLTLGQRNHLLFRISDALPPSSGDESLIILPSYKKPVELIEGQPSPIRLAAD